ncbi:MAG: UvrD-helicase domain-containing protein, partial [Clostridia bacterium]|nr:UvrD-helicase domain-containing protein [Clostridia bacterium]
MELQKEQQLILDTTNKDIIVSAGAGSGKTFVMIEKILKQIITQHTPVTKLLVVTFTNAAASEMRQRLEKRLREYLATLETDSQEYLYVLQQISLLPQSNISTLHKFCQNIIAKYFYVLDIDTSFSILEEADTAILYNRACDDILREAERAEEPGIV